MEEERGKERKKRREGKGKLNKVLMRVSGVSILGLSKLGAKTMAILLAVIKFLSEKDETSFK